MNRPVHDIVSPGLGMVAPCYERIGTSRKAGDELAAGAWSEFEVRCGASIVKDQQPEHHHDYSAHLARS